MKKVEIGSSGMMASQVAMGTWSMGGDVQWGPQDEAVSLKALHTALEEGVNLIDTAPAYGFGYSERLVGKAIKELPRDQILVQTKCGFWWKDEEGAFLIERDGRVCRRNVSRRAIMDGVKDSIQNLDVDYIDILITHHQAREPFLTPVSETMQALEDLKKEGTIRAIGISNCSMEEIEAYLACGTVDVIQEHFSMLEPEKADAFLPVCDRHRITFQGFSSLEQGLLTGKYGMDYQLSAENVRNRSQWFRPENRKGILEMLDGWRPLCEKYACNLANLVVAWSARKSPRMMVLGGGRKEQHVRDYMKGANLPLSPSDYEKMNQDIRQMQEKRAHV